VEEFEIAHFDISETGSLKLHVVFCRDKYNLYTRRRFSELVREKTGVVFFLEGRSWIARDAIESGLGSN
jgi:hypothetical protein